MSKETLAPYTVGTTSSARTERIAMAFQPIAGNLVRLTEKQNPLILEVSEEMLIQALAATVKDYPMVKGERRLSLAHAALFNQLLGGILQDSVPLDQLIFSSSSSFFLRQKTIAPPILAKFGVSYNHYIRFLLRRVGCSIVGDIRSKSINELQDIKHLGEFGANFVNTAFKKRI